MSDSPSSPADGSEPTPAPSSQPAPPAPSLDAHARADGAAGVPAEPSETLLSHQVARAHIERLEDDTRRRLDDLNAQAEAVRTQRRDHAETKARLEQLEKQRRAAHDDLATAETRLEATEEAQAAQQARGSLVYAGLYTFAGLFFVAGDVIMSREIVANALKLRGDVEPWVFAIGLAMLAILLKPAYDRLVETPYWKGNRGAFAGVIGLCGAGALATLWILGAFRSTAFVSNARIQRLTADLMQASDPTAIGEIQAQIGAIQQSLIESPLGYWAFVVSGVLFAVAGAVCLGIGIRHGRDAYHIRYRLHRARRGFLAECDALRETIETLNTSIADHRVTLKRQQQVLEDLPSLDAIAARGSTLHDRLALLTDRQADVQSRAAHARYRRNYAHGQTSGTPSGASAFHDAGSGDGLAVPSLAPSSEQSSNDPSNGTPRPSPAASSPDAPDGNDDASSPHRALRALLLRHAS